MDMAWEKIRFGETHPRAHGTHLCSWVYTG